MREILFKGKRVDNGEWVFGFLTKCQNREFENGQSSQNGYKYQIISHQMPFGVWDVIPTTVSQYTGLKDKNGNKIFEGDKLKAFGSNYELVYNDGSFYLKRENVHHILSRTIQDLEIIGNIYEDGNK